MLYGLEEPWHKLVLPEMVAGCAGMPLTPTTRDWAVEEPQPLFALTVMVPPALPAVVAMLLVLLLPAHPAGRDQV